MRVTTILLSALALLALPACSPKTEESTAPAPPETRREVVVDVLHGVEIPDAYRWLEDQESAETRTWIDAQNRFSAELLDHRPVKSQVAERLEALSRVDRTGTPLVRGDRQFLFKKSADQDLWVLYLQDGADSAEKVLIDPHDWSEDHSLSLSLNDVSQDGKLMAYGQRNAGQDEVELRVMNVDTGENLSDQLPLGLYTDVSFTPDSRGFYYGHRDREAGSRIYHHELGTDPADDKLIFGEGFGADRWLSASVSDDGRHLLIQVAQGWARTDLYVQNLETNGPIRPIVADVEASFWPEFAGGQLVVQTDWQAHNKRLVAVDLDRPEPENWRELVPERDDAMEGFTVAGDKLIVHYLHNVASRLEVFSLDGEAERTIELPGLGAVGTPRGKFGSDDAYFTFQSFTTPPTTFRYSVSEDQLSVWSKPDIPFTDQGYEVHQEWVTSKDGTRVPIFLVHKEGIERNGEQPTLLYGYGGFNVSITPRFRNSVAVWLEQGGIYAVANLRGGGEFGEAWHRAGMLGNKQNVFDDFIASAEWLIEQGYTRPGKLAIKGFSNGGLLVGAAMTQRPDLYQAVVCGFPDLDMVRYYQFDNNNPPALLEYGNAADPEQFKFLYAYSPYQKVAEGTDYPAVLLTSGDGDTRVPPLQARKMAAVLQHATSSDRPVLLLYDTQAGHGGGRPAHAVIEESARELTFLLWQLGVDSGDSHPG
ncbi:MAG: prolyl oligopeptidase family serine peptidase [Thermoanaerobaculia bacterium]|nr:prolyl oligopeptidase family serine peptidase [Thermoanaerobaculia bacterium]